MSKGQEGETSSEVRLSQSPIRWPDVRVESLISKCNSCALPNADNMEQGSRRQTASATSARRRVQVGATNRPLPSSRIPSSPAPALKGERGASTDRSDQDSKGNRNTSRLRRRAASAGVNTGDLRRNGTPSNTNDGLNIVHNQDDASRRVQALALSGRGSAQVCVQSSGVKYGK